MPLTRIAIGGEIPAGKLDEIGSMALDSRYHRDGEGVVVCGDYADYFARCADEGKPIVLTRVDGSFVGNAPRIQFPSTTSWGTPRSSSAPSGPRRTGWTAPSRSGTPPSVSPSSRPRPGASR